MADEISTPSAPSTSRPEGSGPGSSGPGGRPPGGRPSGPGGGGRKFFRRKKVCKFCVEKIDAIHYRDVRLLQQFVAERGKIVPRRLTGVCTTHQRGLGACHQAGSQHRFAALCSPLLSARRLVMEVILKEDVNKLGHRGDVVKVADGYGRNFLLPKKLAMEATRPPIKW